MTYPNSPVVFHLSAEVQIELRHKEAVFDARQSWRATAVGRRRVAGAVKVAKILVRRFSVSRGELIGKGLRAHAVDGECVEGVGDCRTASFNGPERLREAAHSGGRIEDQLGAVQAEHHPVLRVVTTVADVDAYLAKLGVKNRVSQGALHVIGALERRVRSTSKKRIITHYLIEIAHSRYVILASLANHLTSLVDHHSSVPHNVTIVALKNGRYDDHIVFGGKLLQREKEQYRNALSCHDSRIQLTVFRKVVVGPCSALSANSVHGAFSRVQKAKGIAEVRSDQLGKTEK